MPTATPETNLLEAQPRESGTKNDARRVRQSGKIPAVVYGAGKQATAVSVDPRQVSRILHSATGHNTVFDLALDGERAKAMIVDWQYEPIKGSLLHIDLKRIAMDQKGGILEQITREVEVECLPGDIPNQIELNVSELVFGVVLRVSDLAKNDKIKYVTDPEQPLAHIITIKEEEAPAEAAVGEAAAAPAEPEVIKKGKQETAEEGAEAAPEKAEKKEKK
jgi:large subunit ribosomal protein L25